MAKYTNNAGRVIEVPDGSVADSRMALASDKYTPVKEAKKATKAPKAKAKAKAEEAE